MVSQGFRFSTVPLLGITSSVSRAFVESGNTIGKQHIRKIKITQTCLVIVHHKIILLLSIISYGINLYFSSSTDSYVIRQIILGVLQKQDKREFFKVFHFRMFFTNGNYDLAGVFKHDYEMRAMEKLFLDLNVSLHTHKQQLKQQEQ